jgi:hypothetical protein
MPKGGYGNVATSWRCRTRGRSSRVVSSMEEQGEQLADGEGWPVPSLEVRRDLEPQSARWPEPEQDEPASRPAG